jgi:hypothetical protein
LNAQEDRSVPNIYTGYLATGTLLERRRSIMGNLGRNIQFGLRVLLRNKGFSAIATNRTTERRPRQTLGNQLDKNLRAARAQRRA